MLGESDEERVQASTAVAWSNDRQHTQGAQYGCASSEAERKRSALRAVIAGVA